MPHPFYPFHSILFFHFFQFSKPFHSIPIFSTIFFNFPNPYTISLPFVCLTHFSHSIPFSFFIFFNFLNPSNYSIPFYFFSTVFFNFSNSYTISLNLNHSYHLEISKVKPFLHHFYKPFQIFLNHFSIPINGMEWSKWPNQTNGIYLRNFTYIIK